MVPLACRYYNRFLVPYVDGTLKSRRPTLYALLLGHLARCRRCRAEVKLVASAEVCLRAHAAATRRREVRRQAFGRRSSIADRVGSQVALLEESGRSRRRMTVQVALAVASLTVISIFLSQPSPARQWIYNRLISAVPVAFAPAQPQPAGPVTAPPFRAHDPFAARLAVPKPVAAPVAAPSVAPPAPPPPPDLGESAPLGADSPAQENSTVAAGAQARDVDVSDRSAGEIPKSAVNRKRSSRAQPSAGVANGRDPGTLQ